MKTKEMKQNQGITLIALVVTVVVLLILAGISIDMVIGKGGIIEKTKDAQEESRGASVEDARDLWRTDMLFAQEGNLEQSQSLDELLEDLQNKGLLTESEVYKVKSVGAVKIGSRTIDFSLDGSSSKVDWSQLEPGLYETGTTTLIKSWDKLVEDNEVSQYYISSFNLNEQGDLVISNEVKEIYDSSNGCGAFGQKMTGVYIPKEVKIDEGAFSRQRALKRVVIEEGCTSIREEAFSSCTNLEEIIIPSSIEFIGGDAFSDTKWYSNKPDGLVYAGKVLYSYKGEVPENTAIEIKEGTKTISSGAFQYKSGLTKVIIPNSVQVIDNSAFNNCKNLSEIEIGNELTEIGFNVFENTKWYNNQADGLIYIGNALYRYKGTMASGTEITVKENTGVIAGYAFKNCTGLTKITLPDTIKTIGDSAFENTGLTNVKLGKEIKKICARAFYKCTSLEKVQMENTVEEIGMSAFYECSKLTDINLSNKLKTISKFLFYGCTSLKNITIPEGVEKLELFNYSNKGSPFSDCTGLESVTIPKSLRTFLNYVFKESTNLKTINYRGTEEEWNKLVYTDNENDPINKATKVFNYTGE